MPFAPHGASAPDPSTQPLTEPVTEIDTVIESFADLLSDAPTTLGSSVGDVRSTLSGTLQDDVARFLASPDSSDLLPVLAASIRHSKALALHLTLADGTLRLVTLPRMQAYACDRDLHAFFGPSMTALRLQRIDEGTHAAIDVTGFQRGMLSDLVWQVALFGSRQQLLPEIDGPMAYRITGRAFREAPVLPGIAEVMKRLSGAPARLDELTPWGAPPDLAPRVLNALYLRSALIVTRACAPRPRNSSSLWR